MLDRGSLTVGMPADILVYDLKNLKILPEDIAYDFPGGEWRRVSRAEGYDYTIVNGVITFEGLRCAGAPPGPLLRSLLALPRYICFFAAARACAESLNWENIANRHAAIYKGQSAS